jgi:ubiquinone/menaquinone biosynthesis C-methylase UbiE
VKKHNKNANFAQHRFPEDSLMKQNSTLLKKAKSKINAILYSAYKGVTSKSFLLTQCGTKNQRNRDIWVGNVLTQLKSGLKILDAGAGQQRYKKYCEHLLYVSQDFAGYDGKGDLKGIQNDEFNATTVDIVCDISKIPVAENSYDVILCTEVFEHIPEPLEALKEFSRILKPGGELIITVPVSSLIHQSPYYYYNGFSKYYFEHHLSKFGFTLKNLEYNGNFFEYFAQEFRRVKAVALQYSKLGIFSWTILTLLAMPLLITLNQFSRRDVGSQEILSHGVHIIAERN